MPSFFDLPTELRNVIYYDLLSINEDHKECWPQILATCDKIKNEATKILYGPENKLLVTVDLESSLDSAAITVGNRQRFHIAMQIPDAHLGGLFETVNGWPRDLSRLKHIEFNIKFSTQFRTLSSNGFGSRCERYCPRLAMVIVYKQLFVFTSLLGNNSKVNVKINMPYGIDMQALTPLLNMRPGTTYSVMRADIDRTIRLDALSFYKPAQAQHDMLATFLPVQRDVEDFLALQKRAKMEVRGSLVLESILKRMWWNASAYIFWTGEGCLGEEKDEPTTAEPTVARKLEEQVRAILASGRLAKIREEALERIARLSQS